MSIFKSALSTIKDDLTKIAIGTAHSVMTNHSLTNDEVNKLRSQHNTLNFVSAMIGDALTWIANNQDASEYPSTLKAATPAPAAETNDQPATPPVYSVSMDDSAQNLGTGA